MTPPMYGSDMIADLLRAAGIHYVALNPGATFRGLHDSLVNHGGNRQPEIILTCHEEIAVALAHGYAKAAGEPMAAVVHNLVGLQHATMAIYNAWCDRVPMLVLGGTGPMAAERRRPWIDWVHTALVQGEQVRAYVKWDDQPASVAAIPHSLWRGIRLAVAEPQGPVYICYDVDLQEQLLPEPAPVPPVDHILKPGRPGPDPAALATAAQWLATARQPVIIAGLSGRHPESVANLVALAETLAAPVIDTGDRFSFPSTHPLDLTFDAAAALCSADVVLALDVPDLFGAISVLPKVTERRTERLAPNAARLIHITMGEVRGKSWAADYQQLAEVDLTLPADTGVVLPLLLDAIRARLDGGDGASRRESRRAQWTARHRELQAEARATVEQHRQAGVMTVPLLADLVGQALQGSDWVLASADVWGRWCRRLWGFTQPGCYLGDSEGAGLGYTTGAALGACLAHRGSGKVVVSLQGDGDFLFTPSALWTAAHHRLPLLTVILNNGTYGNDERHQEQIALERGRPVENKTVGIRLEPPRVDFAALARSFGIWTAGPVHDPGALRSVLDEALAAVRAGQPALVDVVVAL